MGSVVFTLRSSITGGETVDALGSWWFQYWVASAVGSGASLESTDMLFFPWGKDILTHTGGNLLDALLIVPLRAALGPAFAWNALVFFTLLTNGLAAAVLARRHDGATMTAAVAFAILNPFPLHELAMGRPTQAILAPLFLALAAGDAAYRDRSWKSAALAGLALALQGWIYWYAAGFGAIALILLALGRPLAVRLGLLSVIGGVSVALTSPIVLPLLGSMSEGAVPGLLPVDAWQTSGPVFQNAEGGTIQLGTLGPWGLAGFQSATGWVPEGPTLGLLGVAAVLFAPWRWWIVAIVAALLAVGPFPGGEENPLYVRMASALTPMERLYWPVRALAVVVPAGVVGVIAGLARVPERWRRVASLALVLGVGAEAGARSLFPLSSWTPAVPAGVACLARAEGAVITLPYGWDQVPLLHQTFHGRPMLNGMHERSPSLVPAGQQALRAQNGWLRALLTAPADPVAQIPWSDEEKAAIHDLGYRFVVLRTEPLLEVGSRASPTARLRAAQRRIVPLAGAPVHTSDEVVIYAPWGGWPGCEP